MSNLLNSLILALVGVFPLGAMAQDAFGPISASEVVLADQLYVHRIVAVFADSPNDPAFIRQMEILAPGVAELALRDVLLVTDTSPKPPSELRARLHPRGFSLVIMDKDGTVAIRKPLPWDAREISRAIDKFPSRRDEMLERSPAGR